MDFQGTEENIHVASSEATTNVEDVLESTLVELAQVVGDVPDPVSFSAIYINTLAGMGAASVHMMSGLSLNIQTNPREALPQLAEDLKDAIYERDPDIGWLQDIIGQGGFVGWALILNGFDQDNKPLRIVVFHSRTQGIFLARVHEDDAELQHGWVPLDTLEDHPIEQHIRALVTFNELTHFARVRWEQYGVSVCEEPEKG